jgi:hypothetical protein
MIAFAAMLLAAAAAAGAIVEGAAPVARAYARFAFVLYAALAIAMAADMRLAGSVALIVCALAPALLTFALVAAVRKPPTPAFVSPALAFSCCAGMAAAATGITALSLGPLLVSVVSTIAVTLASGHATRPATIQAVVAAAALLCGASALVDGAAAAPAALAAFTSAGLIGIALSMIPRSDTARDNARGRTSCETEPIHTFP